MRALCLAVKPRKSPPELLEHVRIDPIIDFAFEGKRAIADGPFGPVTAEPPPMSKEEFTSLLERWITEAAMACSTDGTLTLTDNVTLDSPRSPNGKTTVRNKIDASIFIKSEVATSELRYDETSTFVFTPVGAGLRPQVGAARRISWPKEPPRRGMRSKSARVGSTECVSSWTRSTGRQSSSYREQLCRPPSRRREELADPSTDASLRPRRVVYGSCHRPQRPQPVDSPRLDDDPERRLGRVRLRQRRRTQDHVGHRDQVSRDARQR